MTVNVELDKIKLSINKNIINKPDKPTQPGWTNSDFTPNELIDHIISGFAFSQGVIKANKLNGFKPSASDIEEAWLIPVDIDNEGKVYSNGKYVSKKLEASEGYYSFDDAISDTWLKENALLIYTTPSHTDEHHRFRIVFLLEEAIKSPEEYTRISTALIDKFNSDKSCKNIDRMFYGNTNAEVFPFCRTLEKDQLETLLKSDSTHSAIKADVSRAGELNIPSTKIAEILTYIPPQLGYHEWLRVVSAVGNYLNDDALATQLVDEWSPDVKVGTAKKIRNRLKQPNISTLLYFAKMTGMDIRPFFATSNSTKVVTSNGTIETNVILNEEEALMMKLVKTPYTDMGNAERFVHRFGDKVRYNFTDGSWYIYNGIFWEKDEISNVYQLAKETIRAISEEANYVEEASLTEIEGVDPAAEVTKVDEINSNEETNLVDDADEIRKKREDVKKKKEEIKKEEKAINKKVSIKKLKDAIKRFAKTSEAKGKIEAMLSLAKQEKKIACKQSDFDKNLYLFNCEDVVYDLETNNVFAHSPDLLLSKIAPVKFEPEVKEMDCPKFEVFLDDIFDGDYELIRFVQRAIGLSLCGAHLEEALFFAFGSGKNGKSVFFKVIEMIIAEYYQNAPAGMLLQNRFQKDSSTDVARLPNARFVIASELPENGYLNESKVKDLTGGDTITARFLYQNEFSFKPTHTLWVFGNHKPKITGTDNGIWRRIYLIPFLVTISAEKNIPQAELMAGFEQEKTGIFKWMIEGWKDYQQNGLNPPEVVLNAVEEYRNEEDKLGDFIQECCKLDATSKIVSTELLTAYNEYCKKNEEFPIKKGKFKTSLLNKGVKAERGHLNKIFFLGIELNNEYAKAPRAF